MEDQKSFITQAYFHLMTDAERRAERAFFFHLKMQGSELARADKILAQRKKECLADPVAAKHFRKGRPRFLDDVLERMLSEHADEIVRCDKCDGILRTPKAKQCLYCGHDWH